MGAGPVRVGGVGAGLDVLALITFMPSHVGCPLLRAS